MVVLFPSLNHPVADVVGYGLAQCRGGFFPAHEYSVGDENVVVLSVLAERIAFRADAPAEHVYEHRTMNEQIPEITFHVHAAGRTFGLAGIDRRAFAGSPGRIPTFFELRQPLLQVPRLRVSG
jgi:hypothetical protein